MCPTPSYRCLLLSLHGNQGEEQKELEEEYAEQKEEEELTLFYHIGTSAETIPLARVTCAALLAMAVRVITAAPRCCPTSHYPPSTSKRLTVAWSCNATATPSCYSTAVRGVPVAQRCCPTSHRPMKTSQRFTAALTLTYCNHTVTSFHSCPRHTRCAVLPPHAVSSHVAVPPRSWPTADLLPHPIPVA